VDQSDAVAVTVAADAGNTSAADLVADLNAALNATSVAGHAYLGSGGLGFSSLGQAVQAILNNGQIELVTQSSKLAAADPRQRPRHRHHRAGLHARPVRQHQRRLCLSAGRQCCRKLFGGRPRPGRQHAGQPRHRRPGHLGMLDLSFTGLLADYGGSMAFSLRNGLTGAAHDRISLNALYDSAASQTALLGLGSDLTTSSSVSATAAPFQSNGQLLRDVGLSVTVGTTVLDVVVTRPRPATTAPSTTSPPTWTRRFTRPSSASRAPTPTLPTASSASPTSAPSPGCVCSASPHPPPP
jgi:hypothetical protein